MPRPIYPRRYDLKLYVASWTCREKYLYFCGVAALRVATVDPSVEVI